VVLTVLCAVGIVSSLQYVILIPLLARFPELLHESPGDTSWIVTAGLLSGAVATPLITRLADMRGKRLMTMVCLGMIVVGSLIPLLFGSLWALILSRVICGASAGMLPIGISMLRDELPPKRLGMAIAVLSTMVGVSSGLGLPLGGWLAEAFGWLSVFVFSGAVALLLMVITPLVLRESSAGVRGRFDVVGALLLSIALIALMLGVSKGGEWGWLSPVILGLFGLTLASGAAWFVYERRTTVTPIVDLKTSFSRPILIANISAFSLGLAMFGNMIITTAQVQIPVEDGGFGMDTFLAGLVLLPAGLTISAMGPVAGLGVQRFGAKITLIVGILVLAAGNIQRLFALDSLIGIIIGAIIIQIGVAFTTAAQPTIITRNAPIEQTASANGVNALVRSVGTTMASAVIAAAFTLTVIGPSGEQHPSPTSFLITFSVAAGAALISALIAAWLPGDRPRRSEAPVDPGIVPA